MDYEALLDRHIDGALGSVPPVSANTAHPWAAVNHPSAFLSLKEEEQKALLKWIDEHLVARKTVNRNFTSYGLKHEFENVKPGGFYMSNGAFKGGMIVAGHLPADWHEVNQRYRIGVKR